MRGPHTLAAIVFVALSCARIATAQTPRAEVETTDTATAAVTVAQNAFEYRDFERVVKLLNPWLHPRRILKPDLAVRARRLLGVSLHVLGRVDDAKEEFAELLLLDPQHKLDPFLVPPAVIQAFENVRTAMRPTLDEILKSRGVMPPIRPQASGPPVVRIVEVPPLAIAVLPGGVPQFVADEPGWGLLWAVLQVGFLTLNLVAFDQAGRNNDDGYTLWTGLQYAGLAGFLGTWTASGLQGYSQLKAVRDRNLREALEPALSPAPTLTPRTGIRLGWEF